MAENIFWELVLLKNLIKESFVGKYMLKTNLVVTENKAQHYNSINKIKW